MVIIHAVAMRARGLAPVVLVDDHYGQQLDRRMNLPLLSTERVLVQAARTRIISDRARMRNLYSPMRLLDDGLVDISQTKLLDPSTWSRPRT